MRTSRVDEIFTPINGVSVNDVKVVNKDDKNAIKYLRPSNSYKGVLKDYIDIKGVKKEKIFPKGTLFVSTNGQGSHSFAYVSTFKFVPNSDVVVLIPKKVMPVKQKVFYSLCITKNRYKFSYGRKPKGNKLGELLVPSIEEKPAWFDNLGEEVVMRHLENELNLISQNKSKTKSSDNDELVPLRKLFNFKNGISSSNVKRYLQSGNNGIRYIRPSNSQESSVDAFLNLSEVDSKYVFSENTLYVSTDGQGSHSYAYVSVFDFVPNSNVVVLEEKEELSLQEKLFYAFCITRNRYKFSYGRKPKGDRLKDVLVPSNPSKYVKDEMLKF